MKRIISALIAMCVVLCVCLPAYAQSNATLNISKNDIGEKTSPSLYGLTLDEASFAVDGGLVSNMVCNNSFEYADNPEYAWSFNGVSPVVSSQGAINSNNPTYETVTVESSGNMINRGYTPLFDSKGNYDESVADGAGMSFVKGKTYLFSCYLRNVDFEGKIGVFIDSKGNKADPVQLNINSVNKKTWTRINVKIKSSATESGRLGISFNGTGSVCIDYVTLCPADSYGTGDEWKYVTLRQDMVDAIKNLKPSYLKFPGACSVEDTDFSWKNTIGEPALRKQYAGAENDYSKGLAVNNTSLMGYHEYFQLARDINAVPVAVVGAGVACQTNGRYEAYLQAMNKTYMTDEQWETYLVDECGYKKSEVAQRTQYIDSLGVKSADDFDAFVDSMSLNPDTAEFTNYAQDVLDLIEYANAPSTAGYWASLRSANGSEQPFNLKYIQVGGDNYGDVYWRNFEALKKIINKKYPDIVVLASTGFAGNGVEFDTAWNRIGTDAMVSENVTDSREYPLSQFVTRYDSYATDGTDVMVQYKSEALKKGTQIKDNNLFCAVQEGAFATGIERNSGVVKMSSYMTAFSKIDAGKNTQSLAWFDNESIVLTPSYYTQMIFAGNYGGNYVNSNLSADDDGIYQSVTIDEGAQALYIKLVNVSGSRQTLSINLSGFDDISVASMQSVGADTKSSFNSPKKQTVAPVQQDLEFEASNIDVELLPYSANVVRVGYGQNSGAGFFNLPDGIDTEVKSNIPMGTVIFIILVIVLFVLGSFGGYFAYSKLVLGGKGIKDVKRAMKEKKDDDNSKEE